MESILNYVEVAGTDSPKDQIWLNLSLMLISGVVYAIAHGQTVWLGEQIKLRLRGVIISEIYRKVMIREASSSEDSPGPEQPSMARSDSGTIVNLISSDSDKIADAGANAYEIWASVPIRVAIALGLLYRLLGLSSLAGVVMMLAITPINSLIFRYMGKAVMEAMAATDIRVQETNQLLRNIRMIKLFVWEDLFQGKLLDKRSKELGALRGRLGWWSIMATVWYAMPSVITFLAFFAFTAIQQRPLLPSTAFTALSLFNLLKAPLDQLVGLLARVQESMLSLGRVEGFLKEGETRKHDQLLHRKSKLGKQNELLGFDNATLSWGYASSDQSSAKPSSVFTLRDIDVSFTQGSLNILAGPTGCGKTSLLLGLLGEMPLLKARLAAQGEQWPTMRKRPGLRTTL